MGFLKEVAFTSGLRRELKGQQVQLSLVTDKEVETQREHVAQCGCAC